MTALILSQLLIGFGALVYFAVRAAVLERFARRTWRWLGFEGLVWGRVASPSPRPIRSGLMALLGLTLGMVLVASIVARFGGAPRTDVPGLMVWAAFLAVLVPTVARLVSQLRAPAIERLRYSQHAVTFDAARPGYVVGPWSFAAAPPVGTPRVVRWEEVRRVRYDDRYVFFEFCGGGARYGPVAPRVGSEIVAEAQRRMARPEGPRREAARRQLAALSEASRDTRPA